MRAPYSRTLFDLLCEQAGRFPGNAAVICGERTASYRELADGAARIGAALRMQGIARGGRVGILINNRLEWLEACFGAAAAGAVAVPFSTWSKPGELAYLLADSAIEALIAVDRFNGEDFATALASAAPDAARLRLIVLLGHDVRPGWVSYDEFRAAAAPLAAPAPGEGATPGDDALILYTSGSSARPKAVRLRHADIIENGFNIGERMGLAPDDRVLLAPPLFWAYGACNALPATLSHGATLVLQERFDAGGWLDLAERHRCTAAYTLPSITGAVLRHPAFCRERLANLRTGLMIGSPEEVRIAAEDLGAAGICNIYGSTETYGNCCVTPCEWPLARRMAGQGPPLPGVTLRIVDSDNGAVLPDGTTGALQVSGYVTPGYGGGSAEHNAIAFTADGYFRTGDLGFVDDAGGFHFVARDADIIKRAGINVSPAEVESLLLRHPGVAQTAVVGAAAGERGEAIVAFVVPKPAATLRADDLRTHCRNLASSYKVPDRIEIRAALPVTETGKLFRRALKEEAAALTRGAG
ncbi:MAG TPA: class I adenylate-forming enzyme family protein [Stellaceae bacterium]|jgi:fatty-acyl-CoA synthase|nr:class I adenylate-forming enzyme family protein [Stellaceae bacterium]